jgi:hypothetical protein
VDSIKIGFTLNQQVEARMTHFASEIKRLSDEMVELWRLYVHGAKSYMGGTSAPSYWPHGPDEDPPPLFSSPSILMNCN